MRRLLAVAAAAILAFPASARSLPAGDGLPAPPERMFEAMLLYVEQGEEDKAARVLEKLTPLLAEIKTAYGRDLAGEVREGLEKGDAWQAQTAVLTVVYYHMKLELSAAIKTRGRGAVVSVRVAYLDYLFLAPRLSRKDKELAAEVERRFRAVHEIVAARPAASGAGDEVLHILALERICRAAFEPG